ncbi:MAG: hypothetical protein JO131_06135, partial [Gammaproteobacteria bacterium]|nr:hypothetical protein [Gammaproteobacteria bacterium]
GTNSSSIWTISGTNTGTYSNNSGSNTLRFNNFQNIVTGNGNNTFNISTNGLINSIQAGSGSNTLNFSALSTNVSINTAAQTATNISSFSGINHFIGGTGNNTLTNTLGNNTWTVTNNNTVTIGGNVFSAFGNLVGGNGDTFILSNGTSITGNIVSSGNATLNVSALTAPIVNLATNTTTGIGGTFGGVTTVQGNAAGTLIGLTNTVITGNNTGSAGTITFNNFGNLTGSNGNDTFTFNANARISGNVNGGSGINTYNFSNGSSIGGNLIGSGSDTLSVATFTTPVTISLYGSSTIIQGTISGVIQFIGSDALSGEHNSTLVGPSSTNTWTISGVNTGTIDSSTFNNFGNITAAGSNNTYSFLSGGSVNYIAGSSSGINTLNYSALTSPLNITLTGTADNGVTGTASSAVSSFSNINNIVGTTNTNNTITGPTLLNNWSIGTNTIAYSSGSHALSISAFQNIIGGAANDNFIFTSNSSIAHIDGGTGGINTLNYSAYGNAINVNLQTLTAQGITGTFNNINQVIGDNTQYGTLTAANTTNNWVINGINGGNVTGLINGFTNISNLVGGNTNANTFNINAGARITGIIDGGNATSTNNIILASGTKLTLTSLMSGYINDLSNNSNIANFTRIQQTTSAGPAGYLEIPTGKVYTVTYYNSPLNTNGEIGDPFYFYNFNIGNPPPPPQPVNPVAPVAPTVQTPTIVSNVMVGSTPSSPAFLGGTPIPVTVVTDTGVTQLIQDVQLLDLETDQVIKFGCFLAQ